MRDRKTFTLDPDTITKLNIVASRRGISRSELVNQLLMYALSCIYQDTATRIAQPLPSR